MRRFVGTTAKLSAGFWDEVARLASPETSRPAPEPDKPVDSDDPVDAEPGPTPVTEATTGDVNVVDAPNEASNAVLVPIDTWTRVMDQLGNLHQAGQQLAEARERAARAETQVEFLKEQLADAKRDLDKSRKPSRPRSKPSTTGSAGDAAGATVAAPTPPPATAAPGRVHQARARLGSWLSPD